METPREKWAEYLGIALTVLPAMISAGFMPEWNVLPLSGWISIAAAGGALAAAIATPQWARGAVAGALMGVGVVLGVHAYVAARIAVTDNATFLKLELVIGAMLGAAPGAMLYWKWARPDPTEVTAS